MGPTSEAKWEGWSEAEGLRRESSRPSGGRVDIRSAKEQPSVRRKSGRPLSEIAAVHLAEGWTYAQRKSSRVPGGRVADSAGKAVGWPDADQGADQGANQGANQGTDQRCGQKMRTGLHFWCARP